MSSPASAKRPKLGPAEEISGQSGQQPAAPKLMETEDDHLFPLPSIERTDANARRLAAAHTLLDKRFSEAETDQLWGRIAVVIPFQSGDAGDINHESIGRIRLN